MNGVLTDDQKSTLTCGLRLAAIKYEENARQLRQDVNHEKDFKTGTKAIYQRMAEQFERQAADARALADLVDEAGEIRLVAAAAECADCGSTGHDTGSNTCPGPHARQEEIAVE